MTLEVARQPFIHKTDGKIHIFFPAGSEVRVYEGERGAAVTMPAEVWEQLVQKLGGVRAPVPSTN